MRVQTAEPAMKLHITLKYQNKTTQLSSEVTFSPVPVFFKSNNQPGAGKRWSSTQFHNGGYPVSDVTFPLQK